MLNLRHKSKFVLRQAAYAVYFVIAVAVLLEIALRIHNPFGFRIKGPNIVLDTNKKYRVDNSGIPVLEPVTSHTKNSLGFRGADQPKDSANRLRIITVGGSTTECSSITDGKTWTDILYNQLRTEFERIWVNNAGLAGHSTFGHIALLTDRIVPLRPDYVLFMVGVNDIRRTDLTDSDKSHSALHHKNIFTFLSRNSELANVLVNLARNREARRRNLTDRYLDLQEASKDTLNIADLSIREHLAGERPYLEAYRKRLDTLINICKRHNIEPVLITQAMLLGQGIDPDTKANLENIRIDKRMNGRLWWSVLEKYNDITRQAAADNDLILIDVARQLPKNSSYFYDAVHFTNDGCREVGRIIYDGIVDHLRSPK